MDVPPFEDPGPLSLKGALILAHPSLRDPNFIRTVLLLTDHEAAYGAHGFVLNRPLGRTVSQLLPETAQEGLGEVPVFVGGPVSQDKLSFASLSWDAGEDRLHYTTHLSLADARLLHREGGQIRAFVGYAGWSEGQLENELQQSAWVPRKPGPEILSLEHPDRLWRSLLGSMGPAFELLARMPDDPSLN